MENRNNNKVIVGELRSSPQVMAWFEDALRQPGGLWCPGLPPAYANQNAGVRAANQVESKEKT